MLSAAINRKACDACTKAKAKCSPFGASIDLCQRCERLSKKCVYGMSLRKRGPRAPTRIKRLEQRVESLAGLLVANGQAPDRPFTSSHISPTSTETISLTQHDEGAQARSADQRYSYVTPNESPEHVSAVYAPYDPVQNGLLDDAETNALLAEFRSQYCLYFPFVIIDTSVAAHTLRHQQPFLFLSIMAVMAYRTPSLQRSLAKRFKEEIATRISECSHKGLEMLQALLVHAAYYHFFYRPGKQQLALMVQMCVATAQDLDVSRRPKPFEESSPSFSRSAPEQRAILGTCYLAAVFAHAWRKRTTMPYTKSIARACQSFTRQPCHHTDTVIAPLLNASELMCRINDYYSYDDIEFSEIDGEAAIEIATSNFRAELQQLRDALPKSIVQNVAIRVTYDMLHVVVYECSYHNSLWNSPDSAVLTHVRARMLHRSFVASRTFAQTLLDTPSSALPHLTFGAWSGWFYSTLLVMKIILLQQTGSTGSSSMANVPHAIGDLLPQDIGTRPALEICSMTASLASADLRDGATTVEECELAIIFQSFITKLRTAAPSPYGTYCASAVKPFLAKVATLQSGLLSGLEAMIAKQKAATASASTLRSFDQGLGSSQSSRYDSTLSGDYQYQQQAACHHSMQYAPPSTFTNLHNPASPAYESVHQPPIDDLIWDLVMNDDCNMFTV